MINFDDIAKFTSSISRAAAARFEVNRSAIFSVSLFALGIILLATAGADISLAQLSNTPGSGVAAGDDRIYDMGTRMFDLIEGNLGSLIMIVAGLLAIIAASLGSYRAATSMLIVAVGAFILRSLVVIFFDFK
ncbi:MAG: hypothetical protein KDD66_04645 [Bdellovibrionales bacterium]|nr:hypothetical protein [Bdellovibrionales bacterium]